MLIALQFAFSTNILASDYFWVGGTGNWNDYANHWATTSGGLIFHTQNPTPNDNVFFDANSFPGTGDTVYINVDPAFCKTMDWSNVQNNPVFCKTTAGNYLNIFGSLILSKNMIWNLGGYISFKATTPGHIFKTNNLELISAQGGLIMSNFRFDGVGGEWTIMDTVHTYGVGNNNINLNIYDGSVICTHNFISGVSQFSATGNVNFDSTIIYCRDAGIGAVPSQSFANTQIFCQMGCTSLPGNYLNFVSCTYFMGFNNTVNYLRLHPSLSTYISGANNHFKDAIIHGSIHDFGNYPKNYFGKLIVIEEGFSFGTTCEVDTLFLNCPGGSISADSVKINNLFTVNSSASNPVNINSGIFLMDSGTVCFDNMYFQNTYGGGGATFYAGANSFDLGNTTGWIFSSCTPAISNVWPGDVNYDLTCDNVDLLNIGVAFNETGSTRPGASLAWTAQPELDWSSQFITMLNVKHADCDGNGVVNAADTLAVSQNYGLTHPFRLANQGNGTLSSTMELYLDFTGVNLLPGTAVSVPVKLKNLLGSANSYGIAFTIQYDPVKVQAGSMYMDYAVSWLVSAPDYIHIEKDFSATGYFDMAVCRTDHQSAYGTGTIAMLHFTVSNSASGIFSMSFEDIKNIDDFGIEIPVSSQPVSISTGIDEITHGEGYNVYPNPVIDYLYFTKSENGRTIIEIVDGTGRTVLKSSTADNKIYLGNLSKGIYSVLFCDEKKYNKQAVRIFKN